MTDHQPEEGEQHKKTVGEKLREHLLAAEVAAEEAAGYGAATTAVEAVEAAVDPSHELGESSQEPSPVEEREEPPKTA